MHKSACPFLRTTCPTSRQMALFSRTTNNITENKCIISPDSKPIIHPTKSTQRSHAPSKSQIALLYLPNESTSREKETGESAETSSPTIHFSLQINALAAQNKHNAYIKTRGILQFDVVRRPHCLGAARSLAQRSNCRRGSQMVAVPPPRAKSICACACACILYPRGAAFIICKAQRARARLKSSPGSRKTNRPRACFSTLHRASLAFTRRAARSARANDKFAQARAHVYLVPPSLSLSLSFGTTRENNCAPRRSKRGHRIERSDTHRSYSRPRISG